MHRLLTTIRAYALPALLMRGTAIGVQFVVMLALGVTLGLAQFGELAVVWATAQIVAQLISLGAPAFLLGGAVRLRTVVWLILIGPACLACAGWAAGLLLWPETAWLPIILCAVGLNAVAGVASLWRSRGAGNLAMLLRDAGPYIALFIAASGGHLTATDALAVVGGLCVVSAGAALLAYARHVPACAEGPSQPWRPAIWSSAIGGVALAHMDVLMLGDVVEPEAVGLYVLVKRCANLALVPISVATWVTAPALAKALRNSDHADIQRHAYLANRIALMWWWPLALCGAVSVVFVPQALGLLLVLMLGGLIQAACASATPVSTLGPFPALAAISRTLGLCVFLCAAVVLWQALTPLSVAVLFVLAQGVAAIYLRRALWDRLGVETAGIGLHFRRFAWRMP